MNTNSGDDRSNDVQYVQKNKKILGGYIMHNE